MPGFYKTSCTGRLWPNLATPAHKTSLWITVLLGLGASIASTTPAAAQIARGQIVDSISGAPIAGGAVILLDSNGVEVNRTISDPEGLFLVRASTPGLYALRVEADGFASSTFPPFGISMDAMQGFQLLVPPASPPEIQPDPAVLQLLERACGADFVPDQPVLLGRVLGPDSQTPVDSAQVFMTWSTVPDFLQAHVGFENATGNATTGTTGFYAVCGAPVGTEIIIHAESEGQVSELVSLKFEDNGVFVRDSFFEMTTPIWRQDFQLFSGAQLTGAIRGFVLDTAGARVANARISVPGTRFLTRASFLGDFDLTGLPPGTVRLSVEQVGYRPTQHDVQLEPGQQLTLPSGVLTLANAPVELAPISVEAEPAERRRNLDEFEKRRRTTTGDFMTREEWSRLGVVDETVDVLRRLRGLRVVPGPDFTQPWLITSSRGGGRGGISSSGGECYPIVFLDRRYLGNTAQVSVSGSINLADLEAVEYHSSTAGMPAEFNRTGAACGVLVFWTR